MTVILERVESYENVDAFIRKTFETLDSFENLKKRLKFSSIADLPQRVVIKPNFLKWAPLETGCTTHPGIVKSIASLLKEHGKEIFIIEGGFTKNAAERYFEEYNLGEYGECINLNTTRFINLSINGEKLKSVKASAKAVELVKSENTLFISVPKLKVHHLTKVTISIKNNMGFLKKPAINMHLSINPKLVDLLRAFNPHLIFVDGIVGGENYEGNTNPVKHEVMLAGDNAVEIDAVGAYLMGFEPVEIDFLRIANERGFGEIDLEKINVVGDTRDIEKLRKKYSISSLRRFLGRLSI